MYRLRLAINVWHIKGRDAIAYERINNINITFTANVPKTDAEIFGLASQLVGQVLDETLFEILSTGTSIDVEVI